MRPDTYHFIARALDWLASGTVVFLLAKYLFNKRRWNADVGVMNEILAGTIEIDVKRAAIDQLLEELRMSDGLALRLSESLMRMAMDFERQRDVCTEVLELLSADNGDRAHLLKARDLLRSEHERTRSEVGQDRKEVRA